MSARRLALVSLTLSLLVPAVPARTEETSRFDPRRNELRHRRMVHELSLDESVVRLRDRRGGLTLRRFRASSFDPDRDRYYREMRFRSRSVSSRTLRNVQDQAESRLRRFSNYTYDDYLADKFRHRRFQHMRIEFENSDYREFNFNAP